MTLKQTQRAGRLQEEGCLEYGEDDSWSTTGSYHQRPLACQEVSLYNQRSGSSLRISLVQPKLICWRKNVGGDGHKAKGSESLSTHIRYNNKNNRFLDYILDARQKELQV